MWLAPLNHEILHLLGTVSPGVNSFAAFLSFPSGGSPLLSYICVRAALSAKMENEGGVADYSL
jgi:hypothetical protein